MRISSMIYGALGKARTRALTLFNRGGGVVIGKDTVVYFKSKIQNYCNSADGFIKVGNRCIIGRSNKGYHSGMPFYTTLLVDGKEGKIEIGDNSRINGAYIHAKESIHIGNNCVIAAGVNIMDSNGHELASTDRTQGRDKPSPIKIGNNVWIGINATILKGTSIGDNCVISAGAVVKGAFADGSIIQGNPAKITGSINFK